MKNYLKENWISLVVGAILGLLIATYAIDSWTEHQRGTTKTVIPPAYSVKMDTRQEHGAEWHTLVGQSEEDDLEDELYYDSLELLACCVEAEAGNQSRYGKKLVVDVVLNRVDNPNFPDNITDVIMQRLGSHYQFGVVYDGRIYTVEPSEETFAVIQEELQTRTNSEVVFFTTEGFSQYGDPWGKVGDHYFSTWRDGNG